MATVWSLMELFALERGFQYDAVILARPDTWFHVDTDLPRQEAGWLAGWLAWLAGWLAGWLACWLCPYVAGSAYFCVLPKRLLVEHGFADAKFDTSSAKPSQVRCCEGFLWACVGAIDDQANDLESSFRRDALFCPT